MNTNATKMMYCPSTTCKRQQTFLVNAGAWCCKGCGWVKEFTKVEKNQQKNQPETKTLK